MAALQAILSSHSGAGPCAYALWAELCIVQHWSDLLLLIN